jgi:putative transposase
MIYKAYKYRLYPTKEQKQLIAMHIGCSRYIYNYGLDLKVKSYQLDKKTISRFDIQKNLPILKNNEATCWLKEVNSQTLQSALENLDNAFTKFFRDKKGFPNFKSKHNNSQSFSIPQHTKIDLCNEEIHIPKFKKGIRVKLHRVFDGIIKTSTISKTPTGKYYISILVEVNEEIPTKKPISENQAIGIDLGIKTFAVLSNGIEIENPKYLKKAMSKLKYTQSKYSRFKGKRTKERIALLHEQVANKREDFLHKISHYLTTNYDTICLETLKPSNMIKNHKLAQALSDIAIGKFNEMLDYKSEWYGCNQLRIGQFEPSSRMCTCGVVNKELKLSDRIWTCQSCHTTHNRDLLASNNIKSFALINLSKELRLKNRNELPTLVGVLTSEVSIPKEIDIVHMESDIDRHKKYTTS